ncbi:MAG: hypothetical protein BWY32_02463 [bacterium ADurb.Bin243]|nr:MAG: hypothetical protein BWY32_02463 [bacterium ADurb.Bin243]
MPPPPTDLVYMTVLFSSIMEKAELVNEAVPWNISSIVSILTSSALPALSWIIVNVLLVSPILKVCLVGESVVREARSSLSPIVNLAPVTGVPTPRTSTFC